MRASADVAVVGAGIVGLATARALRERGSRVILYERHVPGGGQSAGRTRLFRLNHEDGRLIGLAQEARRLWRRWEEEHGRTLVAPEGVVVAGPSAADRMRALQAAGERSAWLDPAEQRAALPLLRPFAGGAALDAGGGPIRVAEAVEALAGALRGRIRRAEVLAVRPVRGPGVEVLTPQGSHRHDAAVLCAGQDTARLVRPLGLSLPVELTLHLRATFRVAGRPPDRLAGLQDASLEHGESVYGAPLPGRDRFALGLSSEAGELDPEADAARLAWFGETRDRLTAYVRRALPGLDPAPVHDVTCWVTRLPWGSDGVAAWQAGEVTAVAGHNLFKLAPVLGELLAEAVRGGAVPEPLRPDRRLGAELSGVREPAPARPSPPTMR